MASQGWTLVDAPQTSQVQFQTLSPAPSASPSVSSGFPGQWQQVQMPPPSYAQSPATTPYPAGYGGLEQPGQFPATTPYPVAYGGYGQPGQAYPPQQQQSPAPQVPVTTPGLPPASMMQAYPPQQQQSSVPQVIAPGQLPPPSMMQAPIPSPSPFPLGPIGGPCGCYGMPCSGGYPAFGGPGACVVQRVRFAGDAADKEADLELGAVVVTIGNGTSYDPLFTKVPQKGIAGTYVATYQISGSLASILELLLEVGDTLASSGCGREIIDDMKKVNANSVVFNWECCAGCSSEDFGGPDETRTVMKIIGLLIRRGHMVMCSDFSLKALIRQWDIEELGPNPFVKVGETSGVMRLKFDQDSVARCPSAQLQRAGELCESGEVDVQAAGGTIVYGLNERRAQTDLYELEVLTIALSSTTTRPAPSDFQVGGRRGTAGHVLLRYKSGGFLLTSAGHWVALLNMEGVSESRLIATVATQYGEAYSGAMASQLAAAPNPQARQVLCQQFSQQVVQQSSPATYTPSMQMPYPLRPPA